jgi:hypothetical protein
MSSFDDSEYGRGNRSGRRRQTEWMPDRRGAIEDAADRRADRESDRHARMSARLRSAERFALAAELGLAFDEGISIDMSDE